MGSDERRQAIELKIRNFGAAARKELARNVVRCNICLMAPYVFRNSS